MRGARLVARAPILLLALIACSRGDAPADGAPGGTPVPAGRAEAPAPDSVVRDTAAFDGTTGRTEHAPTISGVATLTAVRTAAREGGYERIAFEFDGDSAPGYTIEYASDTPRQCGSGHAMDVAGGAHLVIRMRPARAHDTGPGGRGSTIESRDRRLGDGPTRHLTLSCDFEAVVEWVLGLDERRPYRAFTLTAPARLVVDVRTDGDAAADTAGPRASVSPASAPVGGELRVRATGFRGGADVEIGFGPPNSEYEVIGRARTDAGGALSTTVRVPSWARAGEAYVVVVAADGARTKAVSQPVRIRS